MGLAVPSKPPISMIYDCFTLFNELSLLELRFEILDKYVDKFILVESHQTFSGKKKILYYQRFKKRFARWNHKIVHIIAPNIELKDPNNLFERHYLCYELIEQWLLDNGKPEDIAFCSDLDEVWNPKIFFQPSDDHPHTLIQHNYSYWLNYLSNEEWTGTLITKVKNIFLGFNKLNRTAKPFPLQNGGWHFSNIGGPEQIIKKLEAYDHSNEVLPMLSQFEGYGIKERMEHGLDFLGRTNNYQGVPYQFIVDETRWPEYLKEHRDKYAAYLRPESF